AAGPRSPAIIKTRPAISANGAGSRRLGTQSTTPASRSGCSAASPEMSRGIGVPKYAVSRPRWPINAIRRSVGDKSFSCGTVPLLLRHPRWRPGPYPGGFEQSIRRRTGPEKDTAGEADAGASMGENLAQKQPGAITLGVGKEFLGRPP